MATLPTLYPTGYSSQSGTTWTTTTVGNIDEGISGADGSYIQAGTNSTSSIYYDITDTPSAFGTMSALSYNIRYKITPLSGDTEKLYIRVYKSDKTTALTDEMLVTSVTSAVTNFTNKGVTSFTGLNTTATKSDWDSAVICIRTAHTKSGGADNSVWYIDAVELTGTYTLGSVILTVGGDSATHTAESKALTQHNKLSTDSYAQSHIVDNITITYHAETKVLVIPDVSQLHTSTSPIFGIGLETASSSQNHITDSCSITQHNILNVDYSPHLQNSDSLSVVYVPAHYDLLVDSTGSTHNSESISVIQHNILAGQSSIQQCVSDDFDVIYNQAHYDLSVDSCNSLHSISSINITQHNILGISDCNISQTVNNVTINGIDILTDNSIQLSNTDNVTITQHNILSTSDSTSTLYSDNVLTINHLPTSSLSINNSSQLHEISSILLSQHNKLSIDSALNSHSVNQVILGVGLLLNSSESVIYSDVVSQTQHNKLSIVDSSNYIDSNDIVITYTPPSGALYIQNGINNQFVDNIAIVQHNILVPNNNAQSFTSQTIGIFNQKLSLSNVYQNALADTVDILYVPITAITVQSSNQLQYSILFDLLQHNKLNLQNSLINEIVSTIVLKIEGNNNVFPLHFDVVINGELYGVTNDGEDTYICKKSESIHSKAKQLGANIKEEDRNKFISTKSNDNYKATSRDRK